MHRRQFLTVTAAATAGLGGCAGDGSDNDTPATGPDGPSVERPDAVGLETLASGLENPLDAAFPPDADLRYVAEQPGTVRVHGDDGLRPEPLLDLRETVETGFEQGLLGIALHPEFGSNRRLFVRYSAPRREGTPPEASHTSVLAAFEVRADGLAVRPGSERAVLEIPQPQPNHNAGSLVFGPEGYLYVGVGDGGGAGDRGAGHVDDWDDSPGGNGQDVTENLLGSILRIDVDGRDGTRGYAVPDDNPLVGRAGLDEQYAWGFRNPWRLAVDGDDLYAGDVGQDRYEEIDLVERGGNYGWNVREGTHCYESAGCPDSTPPDVRGGERLRDPVVEYPHDGQGVSGVSVIAGTVYRGEAVPSLQGAYVFADYQTEGRLFVARPTDDGRWPTDLLPITDDDAGALSQCLSIRRHDGELYVLGNGDSGGGFHRVTVG